jgi:hypothetical protein
VGDEDKDERKLSLAQVVAGGIDTFGYEYDLGDSWMHLLAVEKELPAEPESKAIARCLDGARACPPEDCGSAYGFAELPKVMKNPKHRQYRSMVDWLGGPFDPVDHLRVKRIREVSHSLFRIRNPSGAFIFSRSR